MISSSLRNTIKLIKFCSWRKTLISLVMREKAGVINDPKIDMQMFYIILTLQQYTLVWQDIIALLTYICQRNIFYIFLHNNSHLHTYIQICLKVALIHARICDVPLLYSNIDIDNTALSKQKLRSFKISWKTVYILDLYSHTVYRIHKNTRYVNLNNVNIKFMHILLT